MRKVYNRRVDPRLVVRSKPKANASKSHSILQVHTTKPTSHNVFRQQGQQYAISDSLLPLERTETDLRLYILGNLVGGLGDTVGKTVGGVTNTVGGLVGGLGKTVGDTAGGLGNTVSGATEGLGNTTSNTGKSVGDTVSGASSSIGGQKQSAENPLGLSK